MNWYQTINKKGLLIFLAVFWAVICSSSPALPANETAGLSDGQTIYVPAYSHIYIGNKEKPFLLTVILSIRNIDQQHPIIIKKVLYYESHGELIQSYIEKPVVLKPLASRRYIIPESNEAGGSGANFIVVWESEDRLNPPIVESVMIGTQSQQGISFTSRGKAIIQPK